ncbi:hypothetical protein LXL04_024861 [Taraxacum kok-saghyz]
MAVGSDGDSDSGSGGGPAIQERRERWAANNRVSRWGRRSRRRGFSGGRRGREARLPRVGMEKKTARWGLQNGAVVATRKTQAGGGDGRKETHIVDKSPTPLESIANNVEVEILRDSFEIFYSDKVGPPFGVEIPENSVFGKPPSS